MIFLIIILTCNCKKQDNNEIETPVITTKIASNIMEKGSSSGGTIVIDDFSSITSLGVCWDTTQEPTIATNRTDDKIYFKDYTSYLSGLKANTTYYVRAYAIINTETTYGNSVSFKTLPSSGQIFFDIDGNKYHGVTIGTQIWSAENLNVTRYKNGDSIINVTDGEQWQYLTTGAFCDYDNNTENSQVYGRLYNFYTIADSREICPDDWHVATKEEWNILIDFLGVNATYFLSDTGTIHWEIPNAEVTNETGFTALPGGDRAPNANFYEIGVGGYWWTSTTFNDEKAYYFRIKSGRDGIEELEYYKNMGQSIRCIKDK